MIAGVSGAAGLSLLGVAGFFIARRRRMMGAAVKLRQDRLPPKADPFQQVRRTDTTDSQAGRPYSSSYRM